MADLSDVTAYLAAVVAAVVYPNGTSSASIAPIPTNTPTQTFTNPMDVLIYEGWPISEQLDLDVAGVVLPVPAVPNAIPPVTPISRPRPNGPRPNVSIYPMNTAHTPYQVQDETYVIAAPVLGLTVSVSGENITITGTPNTGEFVTIEADRKHIYSQGGATASAMLANLLTSVQVNYPAATLIGNTLTVPARYSLLVRQGGVGTLGKVTHRQCNAVMVTVWTSDHNSRSVLASAIDNALKQNIIVTMPDTSQAKIVYIRTNTSDEGENYTVYRRDLIYEVEYATVEEFPGVTITSVTNTLDAREYSFPEPPPPVVFLDSTGVLVSVPTSPPVPVIQSDAQPLGMP